MADNLIKIGQAQAKWNTARTRILKYSVEMSHKGLKEHKVISAPETDILQNKAQLQANKWIEKWEKIQAKTKSLQEREANIEEAETRSYEAQEALQSVENLLLHTLSIDDTVDWESLKKKDSFKDLKPTQPEKRAYLEASQKPDKNSSIFKPTFSFWENTIKSKKERKIAEYNKKYEKAVQN